MSLQSEMDADMREIMHATGEFATPATWNGQTLLCLHTQNSGELPLSLQGFSSDPDFFLYFRKRDFTTEPTYLDLKSSVRSLVTVGGVVYRITSIRSSPDDPGLVFECKGKDR